VVNDVDMPDGADTTASHPVPPAAPPGPAVTTDQPRQTNQADQTDQTDQTGHVEPRSSSDAWFALGAYLAVAAVLVVIVAASVHLLGRWSGYPAPPLKFPGAWLLEGWVRWDGTWYRDIVAHGYAYHGPDAQANVAYFPGYPIVMWPFAQLVGDTAVAGIVVTFASGLLAVVAFQRWARARLDSTTTRVAVGLLVVYPFAWYLYGAVYADALFLVLAIVAFLLLEADHPVWAGLVGAFAGATRPVGIAVAIGLTLVMIERRGGFRHLRNLHRRDAGVLLAFGGLGGWAAYQGVRWGDPLLFADIEGAKGWDQPAGPRTWFKITFLQRLHHLPGWLDDSFRGTNLRSTHPWSESTYSLSILLQGLLVAGAFVLLWAVWKRFGWGYAGYVLTILALATIGTKDFLGAGRYLIGAFPLFGALAAVLADRPRTRVITLVCSAALLAVLASGYARGYYLA